MTKLEENRIMKNPPQLCVMNTQTPNHLKWPIWRCNMVTVTDLIIIRTRFLSFFFLRLSGDSLSARCSNGSIFFFTLSLYLSFSFEICFHVASLYISPCWSERKHEDTREKERGGDSNDKRVCRFQF